MPYLILGDQIRLTKDSEAFLLSLTRAISVPKKVDAFNAWLNVCASKFEDGSAEGRLLAALILTYQTNGE